MSKGVMGTARGTVFCACSEEIVDNGAEGIRGSVPWLEKDDTTSWGILGV
jgi:hypothetical protein